jgi:hypothetical protein
MLYKNYLLKSCITLSHFEKCFDLVSRMLHFLSLVSKIRNDTNFILIAPIKKKEKEKNGLIININRESIWF